MGIKDLVECMSFYAKPLAYGLAVEGYVAVELFVADERLKTLEEFCLMFHSRLLLTVLIANLAIFSDEWA